MAGGFYAIRACRLRGTRGNIFVLLWHEGEFYRTSIILSRLFGIRCNIFVLLQFGLGGGSCSVGTAASWRLTMARAMLFRKLLEWLAAMFLWKHCLAGLACSFTVLPRCPACWSTSRGRGRRRLWEAATACLRGWRLGGPRGEPNFAVCGSGRLIA